ncbi:Archaeal/vacuolar-type H+-ATPase subunit H [Candidatus Desulfosporosinus infrequens]|uniref:Archaeal/vacuolar-type H+-ATPase subunit H n=1 Tax=Candidatus Desulfosporosinus infrequens TaxID=2043169 RepID=A0A2U3LSZ4_9FIRM|nr:Archaeal/vacuolar-type H+-ATPase subunit H [Candidatus Desulfosporosinus infrequens]
MENDILSILSEVEEIVDHGPKIPMTGKVLVDDTLIFELLDRIRAALPEEITNAKWVLKERERILNEAQAEAQRLMERGKIYVDKMAVENEVVKQAQSYGADIVRQAQTFARDVKIGAVQYADEMLQHLEKSLGETLQSLRKNREQLKGLAKEELDQSSNHDKEKGE